MNFFKKAAICTSTGAVFGYGAGLAASDLIVGSAIMDHSQLTFKDYSINFIHKTIPVATAAICATYGLLLAIGSSISESVNENNQAQAVRPHRA